MGVLIGLGTNLNVRDAWIGDDQLFGILRWCISHARCVRGNYIYSHWHHIRMSTSDEWGRSFPQDGVTDLDLFDKMRHGRLEIAKFGELFRLGHHVGV